MGDRKFDEFVGSKKRDGLAMVVGERLVRGTGVTEKFVRWPDGSRERMLPGRRFAPTDGLAALVECPDLPDDWRPGNDDAFLAFTEAFLRWRRQHGLDCATLPVTDFRCSACGREEADCSLNPCAAVQRARVS